MFIPELFFGPGDGILLLPLWMVGSGVANLYVSLPALVAPAFFDPLSALLFRLPLNGFGWGFLAAFHSVLAALVALLASLYVLEDSIAPVRSE